MPRCPVCGMPMRNIGRTKRVSYQVLYVETKWRCPDRCDLEKRVRTIVTK